jgi:peptidyl-prolyl cis-trans isomerase B (cyclophilin B)
MVKNAFLILALIISACESPAQKTDHIVTIKTRFGDMIAVLYDETPKHKANFIKLTKEGFYDSLLFHRVIQNFMIQGGDPQSRTAKPGRRLGDGGPGYTIEAEIVSGLFHEKGALSAARLGDQMNPSRASSGSQFYVVHGKKYSETELTLDPQKFRMALQQFFEKPENKTYYDSMNLLAHSGDIKRYENYIFSLKALAEKQTGMKLDREISPEKLKAYTTNGGAAHLDGQYTVFGKVIMGLDVIDKIAAQPKDQSDRPLENVIMQVTVEELSRNKIEKLYGYHYPDKKK